MDAALIMCFLRDHSADSVRETLEASLPYRDRIVGVGLDSDERGGRRRSSPTCSPPRRRPATGLTMHCDIDQEQSIANIATVLHSIGVERIDHGTSILEDPALVAEAEADGIGFTCCPLSNSFVTEEMKSREIATLLRDGLKVSIASDDPAYFGGYVGDNIAALAEAQQLSRDEVVQLARNSLEISWADDTRIQEWLRRLENAASAR